MYVTSFSGYSATGNTPAIMVPRGTILRATCGKHSGELYQLVRETSPVYAKNAVGQSFGEPQALYNLVNLTTGKARVSTQERKFIGTEQGAPLAALRKHFDMGLIPVSDISHVADVISNKVMLEQLRNTNCFIAC